MEEDKKARRILFKTFWDKGGWRDSRQVAPEDFEYAKQAGYMFDPVSTTHDQIVDGLITARGKTDKEGIADAFVASLGNRRVEMRSALGSYAVALNFLHHSLTSSPRTAVPSGAQFCEICGLYGHRKPRPNDLNVLNFERCKWGGVRHTDPQYIRFDLEQFEKNAFPKAQAADYAILRDIFSTASKMPETATPSNLERALKGLFKSNTDERRVLIEILSYCGILQPRDRSGFFNEFTWMPDREHTGQHHNDWSYPAIWWRGKDGVNEVALRYYFPSL